MFIRESSRTKIDPRTKLPVDTTETNIVGRTYFTVEFRGKRNGQQYE